MYRIYSPSAKIINQIENIIKDNLSLEMVVLRKEIEAVDKKASASYLKDLRKRKKELLKRFSHFRNAQKIQFTDKE